MKTKNKIVHKEKISQLKQKVDFLRSRDLAIPYTSNYGDLPTFAKSRHSLFLEIFFDIFFHAKHVINWLQKSRNLFTTIWSVSQRKIRESWLKLIFLRIFENGTKKTGSKKEKKLQFSTSLKTCFSLTNLRHILI